MFTFSIHILNQMIFKQHLLTNEKFIACIWKWKYCGIFSWVSISYIIYTIFCRFLLYLKLNNFLHNSTISNTTTKQIYIFTFNIFYPLVILTASVPLYFYILSLTIVPIRHNVYTLKEYLYPFLYFVTQFVWITLHLSLYIQNLEFNMIASGLIILSLFLHLNFTIILSWPFVNCVSKNDKKYFKNRSSAFRKNCLYNFPPLPLIISFFFFYYLDELYVGLIVTSTIYISFLFTSICSLIIGEKVSFKVNDGSRLKFGLSNTKSQVVKYWAYCDLLDTFQNDKPAQRKFIFSNGGDISSIIICITRTISDMANSHESISTDVLEMKKPVSSLKESFIVKAKKPFRIVINYFKGRWSNTMNMKKERNASQDSIIVILGIEILVRMIFLAQKEDKNGEIQQHAELILNTIVDLYKSCMRTQALVWKTPPFGEPWIVKDYQQLTVEVLNASYTAIVNLIRSFGNQLDMTLIKKSNKEIVDAFMKYESRFI